MFSDCGNSLDVRGTFGDFMFSFREGAQISPALPLPPAGTAKPAEGQRMEQLVGLVAPWPRRRAPGTALPKAGSAHARRQRALTEGAAGCRPTPWCGFWGLSQFSILNTSY